MAGGDLLRGVPEGRRRRGRCAHPVPPVLLARRDPQPRQRADTREHPRGWRARVRVGPRGRRGLRQPGPHGGVRRRRRRGRDGSAVGVVAAAGVPEPTPRRRRPPGPPPQRLQDRRSHGPRAYLGRGRRGVPAQPGLGPRRRLWRRPPRGVPGAVRRPERRARAAGHPTRVAGRRGRVAGDHPADAEGLDRPRRGRRGPGAGHLPRAPGAAVGPDGEPRAPADAGGVAAVVLARDAVRRVRPARARAQGARARRRQADVRDAVRERRAARGAAARRPGAVRGGRSRGAGGPWSATRCRRGS